MGGPGGEHTRGGCAVIDDVLIAVLALVNCVVSWLIGYNMGSKAAYREVTEVLDEILECRRSYLDELH